MKAVLFAVSVLTLFIAVPANAQYYDRVLVLGNGYAAGPGGFPLGGIEPLFGDLIAMEGTIQGVNGFFEDLLPSGPYELTYVFAGTTCISSSPAWPDCGRGSWGLFVGGLLWVYLDMTPDADFTNGETFTDGELVLVANQVEHRVTDTDGGAVCSNSDDWTSQFFFYDGTWFPRISDPQMMRASLGAEIDGDVPAGLAAVGFTFHVQSGDIAFEHIVAVEPTTWGRVKSLYRK
jgi:hypothetical protein